jgi:4-hydroxy-tetrahydrodipicolinate reductase
MEGIADMDVFVRDIHHRMKADSPSGTALTTARVILDHSTRKKQILTDEKQPPQLDQLQISSARGGYIFGEHEVTFDSPQDTLQIIHTAKSRMGFAKGSLAAARWVSGKTGFFTIDDYLNDM